jgi:perosamine synthetase
MTMIPVAGPSITQREIDAVTHAVTTNWFGRANEEIAAFEREFAAATARAHAIALPSCTAAIHLALLALGVGPGDEVIVPESTWIASVAPVSYVGATPVFVDVDPVSWCLTAEAVEEAITPRTKAVIPVDLYGGFPELVALEDLCRRHGLALVEDAAEAAGGSHQGRPAGNFGAAATFSFHGSKTLTTGEGGMVVCDDDALWERMLFLRDHGRLPGDTSFYSVEVAWKYKMTSMQAAIGRVQLDRLGELIDIKRRAFGWYAERLSGLPLAINAERAGDVNSYWMATAVLDADCGVDAASLADSMQAAGIATRPFFPALSSLPAFSHLAEQYPPSRRAVADRLRLTGLNLPSSLQLTESDADVVCQHVRQRLRRATDRGPS